MKIQFFYDYECPFCKNAYDDLMDLLPSHPNSEIDWRPVEAHPRPEKSWLHTDLCIEAFYTAVELGAEMDAFNRALFQAVIAEGKNVEKKEVIAEILKKIVDSGKFLEKLKERKYAYRAGENNALAYEKNEVWFVPAFRCIAEKTLKGIPRLDARGGVGVSRKEIEEFIRKTELLA